MKRCIRLQGNEWQKMKMVLNLIKYRKNSNNHVKGYYRSENGIVYSHWLNDDEIALLNINNIKLFRS